MEFSGAFGRIDGRTMTKRFLGAVAALTASVGHESDMYGPFLAALPVDGIAISTLGDFLGSETVSASDPLAVRIDELQIDFGVGPCWDAMAAAKPIFEPDIQRRPTRVWPAFSEGIQGEKLGAIYAFPLRMGHLRLGAIDLYTTEPGQLSEQHVRQTVALAAVASRLVLLRAFRLATEFNPVEESDQLSRRAVHQATGMVLIQLQIPAADASLIIQGHAFSSGRSMLEVAEDIINGRLNFADEMQS